MESKVYFTKHISPEGLKKSFQLGQENTNLLILTLKNNLQGSF